MKKKNLIMMTLTALFAVGLAFYANNLNAMNKLLDSNVEALSDGESSPSNPYIELGTYPHRIIADMQAHTLTIEGIDQAYKKNGKAKNGCDDTRTGYCKIDTTTSAYNAGLVIDYISTILASLTQSVPLIQLILSLIK